MKTYAIMALRELMEAIIKIGTIVYPGKPENNYSERLFVHQFGDGFVVTSDFYETNAERCVAIAISLMRHMMMKGYVTRVAISTGDMSDINGCYPKVVRDSESNMVYLGMGLMTTVSVMGTALTRAQDLSKHRTGSVLILDSKRFKAIPNEIVVAEQSGICTVDWLSAGLPLAEKISTAANLEYGDKQELLKKFDLYIQQEPVPPPDWVKSTRESWRS